MRKYLTIWLTILLIMPVVGCAKGLNLREVTSKAVTATNGAHSYRMEGIARYTSDSETSEIISESEFAAPDRFRARISGDFGWCEVTKIGDKSHVRTSDEAEWSDGKGTATCVVLPILGTVLRPLDSLMDLERLPDEPIDGVNTIHYRGKVDIDAYVEKLKPETEDQPPPELVEHMLRWSINVELWVGENDYLMRQMKAVTRVPPLEPGTGEEKSVTEITIVRLYDFNKPIAIEPP